MKLKEIYNNEQQTISFEVYPPKKDYENSANKLLNVVSELSVFKPSLISVTYGAGGSTHDNSFDLLKKLNAKNLTIMPHFTCVNAYNDDVLKYLGIVKKENIENILALRGDVNGTDLVCRDFCHANELVSFIKNNSDLSVAVAGYPEKHPEALTMQDDLANLKKKIDAGAEVIFTQLFFDNDNFKSYFEKVKNIAPKIVVIPGILPVSTYSQIERMCELCGTIVPHALKDKLEKYKNSPDDIEKIGIEYAINQVKDLTDFGIKNYHFYILNKVHPISDVLSEIREY